MANTNFYYIWKFLKANERNAGQELPSDTMCIICKKVLIDAQITYCGCRYCSACITCFLDKEKKFCPGNKDDCKKILMDLDRNVLPDNVMNMKISKLIWKCSTDSCGFSCELRKMEDHEKMCNKIIKTCPFISIGCQGFKFSSERLDLHLVNENESHARLLMERINFFQNENEVMRRKLESLEAETNQKVSGLPDEKELQEIRETSQTMNTLKTSLDKFLKDEQVRWRENKDTLLRCHQEVITLKVESQLAKEKNNFLTTEMEKLQIRFKELLTSTETQLSRLQKEVYGQSREIVEFKEAYRDVKFDEKPLGKSKKMKLLDKNRKNMIWQDFKKVVDEITEKQAILTARLDLIELEINKIEKREEDNQKHDKLVPLEGINKDENEFLWTIPNWSSRRKEAQDGIHPTIYSDPFYSHQNGYKMCLAVWPDGHQCGLGTHLGVTFRILRGPFDSILSWPFKNKITIGVINQHSRFYEILDKISFEDFPDHIAWNRPQTEKNEAFGFYTMINLDELSANLELCQKDQILIKCCVELAK